ncbi:FAD binding domain-containing protein [Candidatus Bipolaricaulota bacterium]
MNEEKNRMRNSHILVNGFDYVRPASLEEAVDVLSELPDAKILAGGTNLLVDMKLEIKTPLSVIDITQLSELRGIEESPTGIRIGALTSIRELAISETLWKEHTCLAESAAAFGSTQIMMMGTLGGNIANGSPASDTVPALVVLGAEVEIVGPEGKRSSLVADLLQSPGSIALQPGELIQSVLLPTATLHSEVAVGSAFLKLSRVRADLAKVSAAVRLVRNGDRIVNARIALGSVGPTVIRAKEASSALAGQPFSEEIILKAAGIAASEITPIDDVRSTSEYRKKAAIALVHDAVLVAWDRAAGETPPAARGKSTSLPSLGVDFEEAVPRGIREQPESVPSGNENQTSVSLVGDEVKLAADEVTTIELTVNGETMELDVSPNELLLNVLRERLELTGTKYGCGIGECGACTIWLNGTPVLGCLVLAVSADGGEVRTIEGLAASDGTLDPLQEAFIEENAFQCGYCTPGMLMMTKKLMEEIPQPTEDEVRDYLKGNHCRCTGYASIVRAVNSAARKEGP